MDFLSWEGEHSLNWDPEPQGIDKVLESHAQEYAKQFLTEDFEALLEAESSILTMSDTDKQGPLNKTHWIQRKS